MSITITDEMVAHAWAGYEGNMSMREALELAVPLIEAAVRERCAAIAYQYAKETFSTTTPGAVHSPNEWKAHGAEEVAAAIRADGGAE